MSLDAAAIAGLKVAELKAELEQRGLPTGGKKADLAARLTEAVANEAAVEEEAPAAVEEEAPAAVEEEEQGQEEEAPVATEEEPVEVAPAATDDSAAAPAAAGEEVDEAQLDAFELAKKKRAERFGIPYHPPKKASDPPEDEDPIEAIKRQRAERFGLPYEPPKSTFARARAAPAPSFACPTPRCHRRYSAVCGLTRLCTLNRGQEQAEIGRTWWRPGQERQEASPGGRRGA